MFWLIAKKEFLNNIVTSVFFAGLALCLVLLPYTVYTGVKEYENRRTQYETDMKAAEDVYQKSQVYAQVNPLIVKPVSPLSIFSKGILEQTGSKVKLDRKEKPVFSTDIMQLNENPFMANFLSLDFTTALAILLSLLGILFSYDMFTREKEQGTLKLSLSNPVKRSTFFLGKITGIFLTLLPVLALCFPAIFLIILFSPVIHFTTSDYGRIGVLILMSIVYFAFFVFLGGFVSSRTKSSTSSIILNLFIWCFLLFLLPNVVGYLGKNITKAEDYTQLVFDTHEIDNEYWTQQFPDILKTSLQEEGLKVNDINYGLAAGNDWDGSNLMAFTPRSTMKFERRFKELINPILLANCERKWAIQENYLQQVYKQEKAVHYLSCLSPAEIFKQISALLCRTGMESEVSFMNQARQFQDVFYGYFVQNRIYSSYAYFSLQKESEFPETVEEGSAQGEKWRAIAKPASLFDLKTFGYIDTSGFPRFTYVQSMLGADLQSQSILLVGIVIVCLLLFRVLYVSFIKYDLR